MLARDNLEEVDNLMAESQSIKVQFDIKKSWICTPQTDKNKTNLGYLSSLSVAEGKFIEADFFVRISLIPLFLCTSFVR